MCYICGFVIYKSFLLHNGIVETEILNVRYIEAGIFYLIIAPFILTTPLVTNRNLGYFGSIFTALFAFFFFNSILGSQDLNYVWKACLVVLVLNSVSFIIWRKFSDEKKAKIFDLSESPLLFFSDRLNFLDSFWDIF